MLTVYPSRYAIMANFKRGRDKKKRRSRMLRNAALAAGGLAALGGLAYGARRMMKGRGAGGGTVVNPNAAGYDPTYGRYGKPELGGNTFDARRVKGNPNDMAGVDPVYGRYGKPKLG